uniref:nucleotide exchange factor GrpE n=1 Tax=Arthrobacter sp. TaxID=1667 RepID=UPI002582AB68
MPHHGNEAEHGSGTGDERQEPVIRDNRKVDPETGQARTPQGSEAPAGGGATDTNGDALSQAEEILNAAGADAGNTPSSSEAEELRNDLLRLQAEYVNYRKRVERDRAVAGEMAVIGVLNAILPVMDDIDA